MSKANLNFHKIKIRQKSAFENSKYLTDANEVDLKKIFISDKVSCGERFQIILWLQRWW